MDLQHHQRLGNILVSGAIVLLATQPAWSAVTQVTAITLNPTNQGIEIRLQATAGSATQNQDRPQVFTMSQGNDWVATITNTQLRLSQGQSFRQETPAPGIAAITVSSVDGNSIRVVVTGRSNSLMGQVTQQEQGGFLLNLVQAGSNSATQPTTTPASPSAQAPTVNQPAPSPSPTQPVPTLTPLPRVRSTPPVQPIPTPIPSPSPVQPTASPSPLPAATPTSQPSPTATPGTGVNRSPVATPAVETLNRNLFSDLNVNLPVIDLGIRDRIDRLVLRESPVREALALLARTAGLGIVFTEDLAAPTPPSAAGGAVQAPGAILASTISLDIENEPVQDVFNYILRAKGLRANRVGRTIFIGQNLPATAGNYTARTLRLNQMRATLPQTNMTTTMNSASSLTSGGGQGGSTTNSQVGRSSTMTENVPTRGALQILEELGANNSPAARSRAFAGLQVTADSRTNTLTLLGTPELIQNATEYILKLDVRRKQVAVNVKIVEVNLTDNTNIGASFSFGISDSFFSVNQGQASANVGPVNPALAPSNSLTSPPTINNPFATVQPPLNTNAAITNSQGATLGFQPASPTNPNPLTPVVTNLTSGSVNTSNNLTTVLNPVITYGLAPLFQFPLQFLLRLQAQVTNGRANILTDPTLIVQEGSRSQVNLTSQVFSGFTEQRITEGNVTTTRILPQPPIDVGVILNIEVERIDDNNFITLAVSPEVSSPGQQITDPSRNNLLIQQLVNRRRLETGTIRLRDGQTLILTGIIQQQDRNVTTKTPILGDIPLLNLLFRSTRKERERSEIVVLLTPQVLDDANRLPYGINYVPGPDLQRFLQQNQPKPTPVQSPTPAGNSAPPASNQDR